MIKSNHQFMNKHFYFLKMFYDKLIRDRL